jgi:ABC-type lipoprotein export system ATPase subunit
MDLLKDLHTNGVTICMVTHDPRYAHHAERTIHLLTAALSMNPSSPTPWPLRVCGPT